MKLKWITLVCLLFATFLVACSSDTSTSGDLPDLRATDAPRPHMTPTFIPLEAPSAITAPDWDNVDYMYAAMRPEFAEDVHLFTDTQRYYIEAELTLGTEAAVIQGAQVVRYTNNTGVVLDEIVFRLTAGINGLGAQQRVENVTVNGSPVEVRFEARETIMSVPVDEGLQPGDNVEMTMDFIFVAERGMLPGRIGWASDQFQAVNWMPVLSVYEGPEKGWFRDFLFGQDWDPYYGATGLWEIKLTHAEDIAFGISGITIDEVENGDGTVTEHIVTGPMRDNFMLASPSMGVITDYVDGIEVNVFYTVGGERAAEWVMESALRSLDIFNDKFGEYPFIQLDVAETETNAGGIEYPGIILVDTNVWLAGSPSTESVTAHEVAHQWWYSLVGNNQSRTPFLDESLASWSEVVYWRNAYDDNNQRANNAINSDRQVFAFASVNLNGDIQMWQEPNELPPGAPGLVYYVQGTIFYAELESRLRTPAERIEVFFTGDPPATADLNITAVNRSQISRHYDRSYYEVTKSVMSDSALSLYFDRLRYGLSHPRYILQAFEDVTGQELDSFFYEYLGPFEGLDYAQIEADSNTNSRTNTTDSSFIGG